MPRTSVVSLLALALCAACGSPPSAAPPAPPIGTASTSATTDASASTTSTASPAPTPAPEVLADNAQRATPGGATFTAPRGWTFSAKGSAIVLDAPETDSHVALVDVKAADADAAVAAAWSVYRPDAKRPLRVVTPRAARNGWELVKLYDYETSPNERAVVYATTFKRGDGWTVMIVDASLMTLGKRGAQVLLVRESLRPKGYVPETFAGKKANPLDAARVKLVGDFVELARKELGIPGVAVALIDGDKVVFEGGFGERELGKPAKVDAQTTFPIASNTKGMTTLLLAKLVDEGKIAWDEPVVKAMPTFKLGDADTTSKVLVKHLVCASPADPAVVAKLAPRYVNDALGEVKVKTVGTTTFLDAGEWTSAVATRKNDDGTVSLVTSDPPLGGQMEATIGERGGKRVLIGRDAQHEYVFTEK